MALSSLMDGPKMNEFALQFVCHYYVTRIENLLLVLIDNGAVRLTRSTIKPRLFMKRRSRRTGRIGGAMNNPS
ncbi:MAG: hypothetical protein ACJA0Z_004352 [Halioglobus sp.]|jgi:hypothetical protein